MTRYLAAYAATLVVFAAIDAIWLTQVGPSLYRPIIGEILAPQPRMTPAVIFYLLFIAGIVYFAVAPALASGVWTDALVKGALFGLFAYATYDLTNQATLSVWSTKITLFDMAWGTFLSGVSATGGYLITSAIFKH
ncbi:MAG: rane-like protein [Rhizorhabdus sp.]|nr:rane-like protein [Rhizorhabdus sp.]